MLVPLFGLQLLLTIYRPDVGVEAERHIEYIAFAITNSQVGRLLILLTDFFGPENGSPVAKNVVVGNYLSHCCVAPRVEIVKRCCWSGV